MLEKILKLGNPKLYEISSAVLKEELPSVNAIIKDLHDALMEFRFKYNAGRAIAAPQLGYMKRIIYMHIDHPLIFINPILEFPTNEIMEVWDDCMCFPDLLVKVLRYKECRVNYLDLDWQANSILFTNDLSELIQHEYDHLNGILATQRAIDNKSFALR